MTTALTAQKPDNAIMMVCPSHRMRMISSEEVYASKYGYGEPIYQVFTYHCSTCNQTRTQTIKN
jgi:hypothetical protein